MTSYLNSATGWMKNQGAAAYVAVNAPVVKNTALAVGREVTQFSSWLTSSSGVTTATVASVPLVLVRGANMLGFMPEGIRAGSFGARMMSTYAIANNGGVPAYSKVAILQSIGTRGVEAVCITGLILVGGYLLCRTKETEKEKEQEESSEDDSRIVN